MKIWQQCIFLIIQGTVYLYLHLLHLLLLLLPHHSLYHFYTLLLFSKFIRRAINDHMDAELLLEAYMHTATEIDNRILSIQSRARTTEEFIKIHYDSQRNRLMRINLISGFATLATSMCSFGASLFGMNLVNHLEGDPSAFFIVAGSLSAFGVAVLGTTYLYYLTTKKVPFSPYKFQVNEYPIFTEPTNYTFPASKASPISHSVGSTPHSTGSQPTASSTT